MGDLLAANGAGAERTLWLLIVANGVFLLVALAFGFGVVWLRARSRAKAADWESMEGRWEPALLEYLASDDAPPPVPGPGEALAYLDVLGRFARRLRGAERARVAALAEAHLPLLIERLRHRYPETRARAVQTLGSLGLEHHADVVIAALDDPSEWVAMAAARVLADSGEPAYAAAVLARVERFQAWAPSYVVGLLGTMGEGAATALRTTLADEALAPGARAVAADALVALRHLPAASEAAHTAATTADPELRAAALRLLAVVGRPQDLPALRALCADDSPVVRAQAMVALGRIGAPADVRLAAAGTRDASPWVALKAADALRRMEAWRVLRRLAAGQGASASVAREILAEAAP